MSFKEIFYSWTTQNAITILLLLLVLCLFLHLKKQDYWKRAAREVAQNRFAKIAFCILMLYACVAVLDSVGWRRPLINPDTGSVQTNDNGKCIYDSGASALDYILRPISRKKERSYSAPFAKCQYTLAMQSLPDGKMARVHPALDFPRQHILGTDIIGVDVLVLSLKSVRTALVIGLLTMLLAIPISLILGLASGYYGGFVDDTVQYFCTLFSSIPSVLLVAALMVIFGRGLPQLCIALGIASWTSLCRLIRGEAMRLREAEFTQAAISLGVPSWKIVVRHIMPNVMHIVLINIVLRFSGLVLTEVVLTYLGLGVDAETMSWGTMINDARTELTRDPIIWWKITSAFAFMFGMVLSANIFGDAVRDALDPRLRTQ